MSSSSYPDHPISDALKSSLKNEKNTPAVYAIEKQLKMPHIQSGNAKYAYKKALSALVCCPTYISCLADAIKLKGVGGGLGGIMVKANQSVHGRPESVPNSPASSVASSAHNSPGNPGNARPKKRSKLKITKSNQTAEHLAVLESAKAKCAKLITKLGLGVPSAAADDLSQSSAESTLLSQYIFKPVLLIDSREQSSGHVTSQLLQSNVSAEVRTLPIGDMLWIIKVEDRFGKICGEFLGGVVIERKTMEDLAGSLHGTRFNEQRLRLKLSADVETKIYLVEGVGSTRDVVTTSAKSKSTTSSSTSTAKTSNSGMYPLVENASSNSIRSAVMDTMLHMNFSVIRTRNIDDTINQLRRLHWRIVEGLWPQSVEAQKQYKDMPKMDNWVSYDVLEKQVKHDRVVGTKSITAITSAMLIQIKSLSVKKVKCIVARYPTMKKVREALRVKGVVGGIPLERNGSTSRTVGAQSEIQMRMAILGTEEAEMVMEEKVKKAGTGRTRTPFTNEIVKKAGTGRTRTPFTNEEDAAIRAGVEALGEGKWAETKKRWAEELSDRTTVQIKDRWRNMKKKQEEEKETERVEEGGKGGGGEVCIERVEAERVEEGGKGGGEACIDLTQDSYSSQDTVMYREPQSLFSPNSYSAAPPQDRAMNGYADDDDDVDDEDDDDEDDDIDDDNEGEDEFTSSGSSKRESRKKKRKTYGTKSRIPSNLLQRPSVAEEDSSDEEADEEENKSTDDNVTKPKKKRYGKQGYRRNPTLTTAEGRRALEVMGNISGQSEPEQEAVIDLT